MKTKNNYSWDGASIDGTSIANVPGYKEATELVNLLLDGVQDENKESEDPEKDAETLENKRIELTKNLQKLLIFNCIQDFTKNGNLITCITEIVKEAAEDPDFYNFPQLEKVNKCLLRIINKAQKSENIIFTDVAKRTGKKKIKSDDLGDFAEIYEITPFRQRWEYKTNIVNPNYEEIRGGRAYQNEQIQHIGELLKLWDEFYEKKNPDPKPKNRILDTKDSTDEKKVVPKKEKRSPRVKNQKFRIPLLKRIYKIRLIIEDIPEEVEEKMEVKEEKPLS